MVRKLVCALVVLALCVGITLTAEIQAIITKVDGDKVTFNESKGKGEKGAEKTLPVAKDVKVLTATFDFKEKKVVTGDPLKDGLKNEVFTKIGEKGQRATIVTDADDKKITEIRVFQFKKKDGK